MKQLNKQGLALIAIMALCAATISISVLAQAQTQAPPSVGSEKREHRGPPPESIAACKSLKLDQACTFTSPKGAETGTCAQRDTSAPLACRPARRSPPPEAFVACKGKALNASCSTVTPDGAAEGSCVQAELASALACRPAAKK